MADEKTPLDHALDVLVYAPFGLAMSMRELLPQLAERGRQQLTGQVTMAKMVGQFAVQQGQKEADKAFTRAREQAQTTLEQLGGFGRTSDGDGDGPAPAEAAAPSTNEGVRAETKQPAAATQPPPAPTSTSGPGADALAIPDYDSLSASQVVPRLQGLAADELEAVRAYESEHRGRRTILNRIAQLQG